jgi:hypothetical protein
VETAVRFTSVAAGRHVRLAWDRLSSSATHASQTPSADRGEYAPVRTVGAGRRARGTQGYVTLAARRASTTITV